MLRLRAREGKDIEDVFKNGGAGEKGKYKYYF